jgi:hypothetical protein
MIIRNLNSETEIMGFIENASTHGHKLDCVIVAYTHQHDPKVEHKISEKVPLYTVNINSPQFIKEQINRRGIAKADMQALLECPIDTKNGLVPYGFNRMMVVMEAILREIDILFFVDSDVYPKVLKKTPSGTTLEKIDFFGAHLEHLNAEAEITTGEYSGYNILPPALFEGMGDLLAGVSKSEMLEYWETSEKHRSLALQRDEITAKPCKKILGGNVAIKLSALKKLPPFFSSYYTKDGELFLCRGEDTMLGIQIAQKGVKCTDIGINPLHDTYKNYPDEPDLRNDKDTQERFYYACTGWVGRNPLLNYMLGNDINETRNYQRAKLERGLQALANYTSNPIYHEVIKNFDISWNSLDRYIEEFKRASEAWDKFTKGLE